MLQSARIFIKVMDSGSFSKAAQALKMAPSSVTRHVDKLEESLEITLIKRSTRTLTLTEQGEVFLAQVRKLVEEADSLFSSFKQENTEPQGQLKLSVFESFGERYLCPLIPKFLAQYPKIVLDIQIDGRVVNLQKDNFDLAIRIGRPEDSNLKYRKLLSNETMTCASPAYLQEYGAPKTPEDLTSHNCLALRRDRQITVWHFQNSTRTKQINVQGNLSSRGGTPLLEAALQDVGIVQLPHWMVTPYIKNKKLVQCLPDWESSLYADGSGEVYIVYPNQSFTKPAVRSFIDFIVAII